MQELSQPRYAKHGVSTHAFENAGETPALHYNRPNLFGTAAFFKIL